MTIRIGSNIAALPAMRALDRTTTGLSSIFERLSSGSRINKASDDAAGLAIASSLRADSRIYSQGIRNLNDGLSGLNITQGALTELQNIVQRQLELAEQSANGVYTISQRRSLHNEARALTDEFNRIVATTSFNGNNLLNGDYSSLLLQGGYGTDGTLQVGVGSGIRRAVGTGGFTNTTFDTGTAFTSAGDVASGDFNNDGKLDLITAHFGASFSINLGNGDGTFNAGVSYTAGTVRVYSADVNNDGKLDVISGSTGNYFQVSLGRGDGSFDPVVTYQSPGTNLQNISFGDFNGDGFTDIAAAGQTNGTISIHIGNGNGTFAYSVSIAGGGSSPSYMTTGDFNGDGKSDLIVGESGAGGKLALYTGKGDGSFNSRQAFGNSSSQYRGVVSADINQDGYLDVISEYLFNTVEVQLGNGDGTFRSAGTFASGGASMYEMRLADLTGDGKLDLVNVGDTTTISIWVGNGDGTFGARLGYTGLNTTRGATIGDFNGDGVPDLVVGSFATRNVSMLTANTIQSSYAEQVSLMTRQDALSAMDMLTTIRNRVSKEMGAIGAHMSRIGVAVNTLTTSRDNFVGAESRISDSDVAADTAELIKHQILQKAASSILHSASLEPTIALNLLKG